MKFYTEVTIDTLYKRTWSEEAIEHAGVIWRVSEGNKCFRTLPFAFDLSLKKKAPRRYWREIDRNRYSKLDGREFLIDSFETLMDEALSVG